MTPSRRGSVASLIPPSPSITNFKRPHSVAETRPGSRMVSDPEPESRNVRVVLRIRPSDPDDASVPPRFRQVLVHPTSTSDVRVDVDPAALAGQALGSGSIGSVKKHPVFNYDHVLGEDSTQVALYDAAASGVIEDFLKGHNVTFLAYGQTSSGKSYSMGTTGDDLDYAGANFTPRTGLIPRTVHAIFERAEEIRQSSGPGATWECKISFLELYNEEIIDILSGSGVQVAIREEKDGRIIWSGVREVKVKTLADVMALLQDGSARRKTGETGMNATSSRSHAIFSLTMVQKRRIGIVGNGMASSASQPLIDTGTKMKRPNSMMSFNNRSTTPSGTRSTTPSGSRGPPTAYSTQQKTSLPRPNSMQIAPLTKDDEMIIVTSKFNMVDLAGSERLKRTAAQGERMKEGISINSGLLALGNVISQLAEPSKARGHIPYRDSKLTRMLQDSIGGNALTTMIACVSPIEYNISETLNTMKYASRARNIRNTAKANQVEAGWDDVEHLQSTVLKLRKQLIEVGGEIKANVEVPVVEKENHSGKLIVRLAELQKEHTALYDKYLAKCSEGMRLTTELRSARPGDNKDALAKFNETVEPVILEYEKVVAALNAQLEELREEISTLTDMYEAQGQQLQTAVQLQADSENYVIELRGRLAKLTERNAASEGYIRDLETKLKSYAEQEGKHADVVSTLRKEIANHQAANVKLSQHTTELENRLTQSEDRGLALGGQIGQYEKEAERHEKAFKDLESHISLLDTTEDNKALLEELQQREIRICEMEKEYRERHAVLELEKQELQKSHDASSLANSQLRAEVDKLNVSTSSRVSVDPLAADTTDLAPSRPPLVSQKTVFVTPPESPATERQSFETDEVAELRRALRTLTAKYHESELRYSEAENQIMDLRIQLDDAHLAQAEVEDIVPPSPSNRTHRSSMDENSDESMTLQTPKEEQEGFNPSPTKPTRGGYRGSMPNLSLLTHKGRDFRSGRGVVESRRARPQSLSQELSSAHSPGLSSRPSWGGPNSLLLAPSSSRQSMPIMKASRSLQSLEAELRFVHEKVNERDEDLRDRETYIKQLEDKLEIKHATPSHKSSAQSLLLPQSIPLPPSPITSTFPPALHVTLTKTVPNGLEPVVEDVSPVEPEPESTEDARLQALKASLSKLEDGPKTETQVRVDDLLRVMAAKEAELRKTIDNQSGEIAHLRKSNNRMKEEIFAREPSSPNRPKNLTLASPIQQDDVKLEQLRREHDQEMEQLVASHSQILSRLQADHEIAISSMRATIDELRTAIGHDTAKWNAHSAQTQEEYAVALAAMEKDNEALVKEMESQLATSEDERRQLKMKADQAMFELSRIRDQGQLQQNVDAKQINELKRVNSSLGRTKAELETNNNELSKRLNELEIRNSTSISRRASPLPPQGPPPNSPLPPIPKSPTVANPSATMNRLASGSSLYNGSTTTASIQGHGQRISAGSVTDIQSIIATLPEGPQQNVQKVVSERDAAVQQKEMTRQLLVAGQDKLKDSEVKLVEERQKAETTIRELAEARKTNSKLRAHLEDTRQESRRQQDQCKDHLSELEKHRSQVNKLAEEQQHGRASLQAANAQVATLKAQLDRAVEQKVQKRLLKCF